MKIFIPTQTFPPQVGGMENVMVALAQKLSAAGNSVTVLPKDRPVGSFPYQIVQKRVPKILRSSFKKAYLSKHAKTEDLIICDSWKSVAAVPKDLGRLLVLAHGQEYLKSGRRAKRVQKALNRATHIIASSNFTLNLMKQNWDLEKVCTCVIPPTYMLANSHKTVERPKGDNLQLVSICRLDDRKGLVQTMQALADMGAKVPSWHWKIGGSGPKKQDLTNLAAKLGLSERVSILGRVDEADKESILSAADLFVMPSYQAGKSIEGFGISYAEAARFGVACIAGDKGGACEAVIDGETGWCVDTLASEALEACLHHAMTDTKERERRGLASQRDFNVRLNGGTSFAAFCAHIGI
jgi:glycosyltransferase involved in cell wall biosynthesis